MTIRIRLSLLWKWSSLCLWNSCLFFKRKTVAVLPVACCVSSGVATATPSGLKSFKVGCFSKKRGFAGSSRLVVTCVF